MGQQIEIDARYAVLVEDAEVALAWLLSRGDDIVPIPGTKRTARVEENCAADGIELSPEHIQRLDNLPRGRRASQRGADATARALTLSSRPATLTAKAGLSLGDRARLALGLRLGRRVLTANAAWLRLVPDVDVEVIR
jgi:PIN domain nuclease of toxin-antitoxin system